MAFAQQRILIIGGSNGMGLAAAQRLARAGAEVFIAGRSQARLDAARAQIDGRVATLVIDFTDAASLAGAAAQLGRLDHLVLAASSEAAWGPFAQTPADALRRALDNKLLGYWQALQVMLPILRRDGSVVMLSGAASRTAMPGTAGLAAVNGAITQMAQTLAKELAPLRVNVVSPGLVDTPAYDGMPADAKRGMFDNAARHLPAGRTGTSADIAAAIEYLLDNGFTTGALLDVDGGARMSL
ncbi:SDR family oxidoreductase [Niveibacterium umoris]|uniref:NAD(P)-dependent dehydrogenase (Short-subunit alcohol dehydrogenase family) n=1 Tax=Niveibacterium umoris TaxID=1193620 RepID=A0A840BLI4_9RHOO|nr:NAD(P)-dependent dehydrogenase (short-subunit alcohol dehydrogenase family) [Niveibacterium umoris]